MHMSEMVAMRREKVKVFQPVVSLDAIDMVDDLASLQRSADASGDNEPVLLDVSLRPAREHRDANRIVGTNAQPDVTHRVDMPATFPRRVLCASLITATQFGVVLRGAICSRPTIDGHVDTGWAQVSFDPPSWPPASRADGGDIGRPHRPVRVTESTAFRAHVPGRSPLVAAGANVQRHKGYGTAYPEYRDQRQAPPNVVVSA